jgi:CHAT domain-containing protein
MAKLGRGVARRRSALSTLLAFGNPEIDVETAERVKPVLMDEKLLPLLETERLVKTLSRLYGPRRSKVYTGPQAREDYLKREAGGYRILHLATHGILNAASPMYSHLLLSRSDSAGDEDGLLEAWEIMKMDLNADLVVLSACESGRGRVSAGEGVIGLNWALFVAGCPTSVVSLWKVDEASTTELMIEFHRILRLHKNPADALRAASIHLLRTKRHRHPFHWAGFVVVGSR